MEGRLDYKNFVGVKTSDGGWVVYASNVTRRVADYIEASPLGIEVLKEPIKDYTIFKVDSADKAFKMIDGLISLGVKPVPLSDVNKLYEGAI